MTFLWQEARGEKFYRVQTDEKSIYNILKRRKGFTLSAVGLNTNLWIFSCKFSRPDIAKKTLKSVTGCKPLCHNNELISFSNSQVANPLRL